MSASGEPLHFGSRDEGVEFGLECGPQRLQVVSTSLQPSQQVGFTQLEAGPHRRQCLVAAGRISVL